MHPRPFSAPARAAFLALAAFCAAAPSALAGPFDNSLWIGNDTNVPFPVLNTDRSGNVLRSFTDAAIGFGVDVPNNRLYVNNAFSSAQIRDLTTLAPGSSVLFPGGVVSEDLSFDGKNLLVGDFGGMRILRVDPGTGALVSAVSVPFAPLGLTWDGGTGFWATPFDASGRVIHFDAAGNELSEFVAFPGAFAGGLALDTTDGTLFVGTFGTVAHFTTGGTSLGSFSTPDGRFVDGLEFQPAAPAVPPAAVPEPSSLALLALGGAALAGWRRWRKRSATA